MDTPVELVVEEGAYASDGGSIYLRVRDSAGTDIKFAHGTGAPIYLITNVGQVTSPPGPLTWLMADSQQEAAQAAEVANKGTTYSISCTSATTCTSAAGRRRQGPSACSVTGGSIASTAPGNQTRSLMSPSE